MYFICSELLIVVPECSYYDKYHTQLTMYYIRALIYDFLSGFLYVLVLEALRSMLETLRCVLVTM